MRRRILASDVLVCAFLLCLPGGPSAAQANSAETARPTKENLSVVGNLAVAQDTPKTAESGTPVLFQTTPQTSSPNSTAESQNLSLDPKNGSSNANGLDLSSGTRPALNPLTQPDLSPEVIQLLELEAKFSDDVAANGGSAFAKWFAEDGITLANGRSAVIGKAAIAAQARWDPKQYQLTWIAQGARMGPSNDMGFTWGHYDSAAKDVHGETVKTSGRYMTVWRKMQDGSWKVQMESSAEEPQDAGACCVLPKP
jgi:ketosteroid isomerase-like protein